MAYKGLIRERQIEQQEQSFSEINSGLHGINQKCKIEQQGQSLSEINNGL
jgi:hypothetical protein